MGNSMLNNVVFAPPVCTYTETKPRKVVYITTKSGKRIPAYYIKSKKSKTNVTIIYSHGNATDIGSMNELLLLFNKFLDVNILHYEYIGYGLAKEVGDPSEKNVYESIEAAFKYLLEVKKIKIEDIIIYGTSVGSGPSIHIVSKYSQLRGCVLECAFTSCCRVVIDNNAVVESVLEKTVDMFVNISKISKIKCPAMLFHGTKDQVVPFQHGLDLWKKIPPSFKYKKIWIKNANHHNIIEKLTPKNYIQYIRDFLVHCDKELVKRKKNPKFYMRKPSSLNPSTSDHNEFDEGINISKESIKKM